MDDASFWALVDKLDWRQQGADELVIAPVVTSLTQRSLGDIEAFEETLARKLHALDGRAWARESGSAWWGGEPPVSVDAFLYARCVVVANGKEFYEAVLNDPAQMPEDMEFEALLWIGAKAWEAKTGAEPTFATSVSYETYSNEGGWPPADPEPVVPSSSARSDIGGTRRYDDGRTAVRRVIRGLVTGELVHPRLTHHLATTGRTLVMTPGRAVDPPMEPEHPRGGSTPPWRARIDLWTSVAGREDRRPSGLVALIDLHRVTPFEVRGEFLGVEEPRADHDKGA